jgi:hypothetical protein
MVTELTTKSDVPDRLLSVRKTTFVYVYAFLQVRSFEVSLASCDNNQALGIHLVLNHCHSYRCLLRHPFMAFRNNSIQFIWPCDYLMEL